MNRTAILLFALLSFHSSAEADQPILQLFFSPHGGCQRAIVSHIDAAENEILVLAYSLTADPIANALLRAAERGVRVHVVVDRRVPTARSSTIPRLAGHLASIRVDRTHYLMHSKTIIVDRRYTLTGSYNYSANAENRNAEILLIIDHQPTAAIAADNWTALNTISVPIATAKPVAPDVEPAEPDCPCYNRLLFHRSHKLWHALRVRLCRSTPAAHSHTRSQRQSGKAATTCGKESSRTIRNRPRNQACGR